jgi:hypothetical protein
MTAAAILAELRRAGATIEARDGRLRIEAPEGILTAELRTTLGERKSELLDLLREPAPGTLCPGTPDFQEVVSRLLRLTLTAFADADTCLELSVAWLPVSLWFVSTEADAEALATEGVTRGRVWTAAELADLLALGPSQETGQLVAHAKLAFDGDLAAVRQPGPTPCHFCQARRFWRSTLGVLMCLRCHPPMDPGQVTEWVGSTG